MTADFDGEARALLRHRAAQSGLAVDALAALMIELLAVQALLDPLGVEAMRIAADIFRRDIPPAIPPTNALRYWIEALEGDGDATTIAARDDLPQLLLPERLEPRLRRIGAADLVRTVALGDVVQAKRCDAAAAREGLTLTEWVLMGALAS